ncbi:MAG: hypothetical protein AABW51_04815 [Nanoarchaeota archaeon]
MRSNYEMSDLALKAAIGIGLDLRGENNPYLKAINDLSKELYEFSRTSEKKASSTSELMILAGVIWPNKENWKGKKVEDVLLQTYLLAKNLETISIATENEKESIKSICLDLQGQFSHYMEQFRRSLVA